MLTKNFSETKQTEIELRQQANYWQAQHAKAIAREKESKARIPELEVINRRQSTEIIKLTKELEELKAQNILLKLRIFGQQTEQGKGSNDNDTEETASSGAPKDRNKGKRPRGQQSGTPGHGRKRRKNLPVVEIIHDLKDHEKYCGVCGLPFEATTIMQESEEIHYETKIVRRIHKRKCYKPGCSCGAVPGIVAPEPPAKLIPKGMLSTDFWVHIILEKYYFQRPLSRILQTLALEEFDIATGTITGGLEKIKEMIYPLYTSILERNRNATHWHMDETRWLVFVEVDGKTGNRWWLWAVTTKDTVVYILDPFRSSQVPKNHLGENPVGIISADRYSAYKALLSADLLIAYCWAHVRRDYVRIVETSKKLRTWAQEWVDRINEIYHLNNKRLKVLNDKVRYQEAEAALREALKCFEKTYRSELKSENLDPAARKVHRSLLNHWSGLLIFVDYPEIPMDNNLSERNIRPAALGRKNYYGSGSLWSGDLTAALFSILQTASLNKLNPKKHLRAYLQACADNRGNPPSNIEDFLPWDLSEEQKTAWQYPEKPT